MVVFNCDTVGDEAVAGMNASVGPAITVVIPDCVLRSSIWRRFVRLCAPLIQGRLRRRGRRLIGLTFFRSSIWRGLVRLCAPLIQGRLRRRGRRLIPLDVGWIVSSAV